VAGIRESGFGFGLYGDLALAVGAPVLGILLMAGTTLLTAFGPAFLVYGFVGGAVKLVMLMCAMGLIVFTGLRYEHWLVFFGSFLVLMGALFATSTGVERWAFARRAETTTCTVLDVTKRVVTTTDADGDRNTTTFYDYALRCDRPTITKMTTTGADADRGDRLDVVYDTAGRLDTRPAATAGSPNTPLWIAMVLLVIGVALRIGYVLRRR
jgi:hypothetical protein